MIKIDNEPVDFKHFNDGSCRFYLLPPTQAKITWLYSGNDEEIIQLFYLISHLKAHHSYVELEMPYINSARQDRAPRDEDVFTLKYFCNLINSLNIDKIKTFDPHSAVSVALLNNIEVVTPQETLTTLINAILPPDTLIAYPDAGSEKRYSAMLKLPYIVGVKERDWKDGTIRSLHIYGEKDRIANHPILLIDDIMSRGTTIYLAAKQLKEMGAGPIYVYVSHCENTVLKPQIDGRSLLDYGVIDKIFTTNSIFQGEHPQIRIVKEF